MRLINPGGVYIILRRNPPMKALQETANAIPFLPSTAQQVYRVANARYQAGAIGRDELLSRQTQLIQQQQAEQIASSNLLQAKIGLIRALGGGYQAPTNADSKA